MMEEYVKILNIEALTMLDIAQKEILPAVSQYSYDLAQTSTLKTSAEVGSVYEKAMLKDISQLLDEAYLATQHLKRCLNKKHQI